MVSLICHIGDCGLVKRYSKAQVWEFVIIVTIILLVVYRWAWLYDYVPDQYQPSTLISAGYDRIKVFLVEEAAQKTVPGKIAGSMVNSLDSFEKYIRDINTKYRLEEATAKRCEENTVFRFFMHMGEDANPSCSESNLQLKAATQEINNEARPAQAPAPTKTTTTPAN
jgi:hypothetical protein